MKSNNLKRCNFYDKHIQAPAWKEDNFVSIWIKMKFMCNRFHSFCTNLILYLKEFGWVAQIKGCLLLILFNCIWQPNTYWKSTLISVWKLCNINQSLSLYIQISKQLSWLVFTLILTCKCNAINCVKKLFILNLLKK